MSDLVIPLLNPDINQEILDTNAQFTELDAFINSMTNDLAVSNSSSPFNAQKICTSLSVSEKKIKRVKSMLNELSYKIIKLKQLDKEERSLVFQEYLQALMPKVEKISANFDAFVDQINRVILQEKRHDNVKNPFLDKIVLHRVTQ